MSQTNALQAATAATGSPGLRTATPPGNRFELALERNRSFADRRGHEGASVLPALGLFVITCIDPRVDPAHFLGLKLSDAMVIRNSGGRVTPEVINDIAFINQIAESVIPDGPLFEVAVIHHTQCGAGALADDGFRGNYAQRIAADPETLRERAVTDPAATVQLDVALVRAARAVSPRVAVSGHVYDVTTGLVETVVSAGAPSPGAESPRASVPRLKLVDGWRGAGCPRVFWSR